MEEKQTLKIGLATFFLILAIIVIIVMGVVIYKINNDKSKEIQKSEELQEQVNKLNKSAKELQEKINKIANTINTSTSNTIESSVTNANNANSTQNETKTNIRESNNKENQDNKEEILGKWNAYKAVNSMDGTETTNMRDIFGSSYGEFGSYIELKEDGSFLDAIQPIIEESKSVKGSYTIKYNYYKKGDCYIFLTYSDGSKKTLQRVYYEGNIPYLVLDSLIGDYQISLKK